MKINFWYTDFDGLPPACMAQADLICENRFMFDTRWEMERTHEPVHFPGRIDWETTPNGDPEWVFAFNRLTFLLTLGQAWRKTGLPKYADAFARLLEEWLDDVPFSEERKQTSWRAIETGIRCEHLLRACALFEGSPALTPALLSRVEKSLETHAAWLLEAHGPFQRLSNWGVIQNHGLFLLGLAFENERWRDTAMRRLDEALSMQVFPDGSHWEQSPMYHCEVLHCALDTLEAAHWVGFAPPARFLEKTRAMARALTLWCRPDGLLLCQSDTDEIDAGDMMEQAARLFSDPTLGVPAPYSAMLPDSGNAMLRDGPGADAGFLHFHCGCLGSGHGHADLLHVDLVACGESILADSGRYTYVEGPLREALKRPSAHNTLTVDGQDFTVYTNTWQYDVIAEPVKGEYRFTPMVDYVSGGHLGYPGVFVRRRALRLGRGLWVLWDECLTGDPNPHVYERFFHFGPDGHAEPEESGAVYWGKTAAARLALPDDGLALSMVRRPLSREYNKLEESDCLTIRAERTGTAAFAAVIAVGASSPPALSAERIPVTLAKAGLALPASKAGALRIRHGGEEWTVIVCHTEIISQVDLLTANGQSGYGKVLVFGPGCEEGLALAY